MNDATSHFFYCYQTYIIFEAQMGLEIQAIDHDAHPCDMPWKI